MSTTEQPAAATPGPRTLPPGFALYQMAIGHYFSRALYLAAKLGLADLLADGPRGYRALAEATQNARAVAEPRAAPAGERRRLRRAGRRHVRADAAGRVLRADVPGSMRAAGDAVRRRRDPGQLEGARVLRAHRRAGVSTHRSGRGSLHGDGPGPGGGGAASTRRWRRSRRRRPRRSPPRTTFPVFDRGRRRRRRQRGADHRHPAGEPASARHRLRPAARRGARQGTRRGRAGWPSAARSSAGASSTAFRAAPTPTCSST